MIAVATGRSGQKVNSFAPDLSSGDTAIAIRPQNALQICNGDDLVLGCSCARLPRTISSVSKLITH